MANVTLMRANRVAVKANGENIVADFYRTHKAVASIHSENTEWKAPENVSNKLAARESFRIWAIEHAEEYGIQYDAVDRRTAENIRTPRYETDDMLIKDAESMIIPEMKTLADKCATKYPIEWAGVEHDEIVPMKTTASGKELSNLGIENGRYGKGEGNWAWAIIKFTVKFKFKGTECYIPVQMQLVSGQLKKTGMGITDFTSKVKAEIIANNLATEEELDPKTKAPKAEDAKTEEPKAETKQESKPEETQKQEIAKEEKPKRQRKSKKDKDAENKAE